MKLMRWVVTGLLLAPSAGAFAGGGPLELSFGGISFDQARAFGSASDAKANTLLIGSGTQATDFANLSASGRVFSVAGVDLRLDATHDTEVAIPFVAVVPEPHIFTLLLGGVCALAFVVRRRQP